MVEIKITLDEIDYSGIAEVILPIVQEKYADRLAGFGGLLKDAKLPASVVSAALSAMPQHVKDELAVYLVNKYEDKIISTIEKTADDRGIRLNVLALDVNNPTDGTGNA